MLKNFFTHILLKKVYHLFLVLFGVLYLYHVTRFYIVDADCDYIVGQPNQIIETTLAVVGLITGILNLIQIIGSIILKNRKAIVASCLILVAIASLMMLFVYNTLLECFLHGVDLNGLFGAPWS